MLDNNRRGDFSGSVPFDIDIVRFHQLLEFAVHPLDLPTEGVRFLNVVRGNRAQGITFEVVRPLFVGDHPLNVAVCGDNLEEAHEIGMVFQFDGNAGRKLFSGPDDVLEVYVAALSPKVDPTLSPQTPDNRSQVEGSANRTPDIIGEFGVANRYC